LAAVCDRLTVTVEDDDVCQFHLAFRQRARLVEDDRVDVFRAFEDVTTLEQNAVLGTDRRPNHRCRRRR